MLSVLLLLRWAQFGSVRIGERVIVARWADPIPYDAGCGPARGYSIRGNQPVCGVGRKGFVSVWIVVVGTSRESVGFCGGDGGGRGRMPGPISLWNGVCVCASL